MILHSYKSRFILSVLFPLDGFKCNFVSAPKLENRLKYNHDTLQLCRTGRGNVSHTRMTTLILYFLSYLHLMVKTTMPSTLNTNKNIFMRPYGSVGEVVTTCLVYKIWWLLCSYPPPLTPPPHTHTQKYFFLDLDSLSKFTY